MRLLAVQLEAKFGEPEAQRRAVEGLLEGHRADLVLLSEAALTGYVSATGDFDLSRFAEPLEGPTARWTQALAARLEAVVISPLVEREGAQCFNTLVAYAPDGERLVRYRKRHPWYPEHWATPGHGAGWFAWGGQRFNLAVCFDVHFLETDADARLETTDVLLFSSAWVEDSPADASPSRAQLLGVLARRHRLRVLNANWGAGAPRLPGQGGSMFLDPSGAVVASLGEGPGVLEARV